VRIAPTKKGYNWLGKNEKDQGKKNDKYGPCWIFGKTVEVILKLDKGRYAELFSLSRGGRERSRMQ
jgi:hypothetical protein